MKMKYTKIIVNAVAACLLAGASVAAMAVGCPEGFIENVEVDEIIIDGQSCFINDVIVNGNVLVTNSEDLIMTDNVVKGRVRILEGRTAIVSRNDIAKRLVVSRNERAIVILNIVIGSALVNTNDKADVKKNAVGLFLRCKRNRRLDSFQNEVAGQEDCR